MGGGRARGGRGARPGAQRAGGGAERRAGVHRQAVRCHPPKTSSQAMPAAQRARARHHRPAQLQCHPQPRPGGAAGEGQLPLPDWCCCRAMSALLTDHTASMRCPHCTQPRALLACSPIACLLACSPIALAVCMCCMRACPARPQVGRGSGVPAALWAHADRGRGLCAQPGRGHRRKPQVHSAEPQR